MVVKKSQHRTAKQPKHVTLKRHHAKPYRKRHVGLLVGSLIALVVLATVLIQYRDQVITGLTSSRNFVVDLFPQNKSFESTIASSYGFQLTYDQKELYASALDASTGDLYIGGELHQKRAYSIVRFAPTIPSDTETQTDSSALTVTFHPGNASPSDPLEAIALQDGGLDPAKLTRTATDAVIVGGQSFQKTTWQSKSTNSLLSGVQAEFVTYAGVVQGNVVTIVVSQGINKASSVAYDAVISTMSFDDKVGQVAAPSSMAITNFATSKNILDSLMGTSFAAAVAESQVGGSEKVAALYSPAVAKVYNAYCMDVSIDGEAYLKNACSASSGSGFFVSQDGYLGTNGHVAATTAKDVAIYGTVNLYVSKGDSSYLGYMIGLTPLTATDIPASATAAEQLGIIVDALYEIDDDRFEATNDISNLLVEVTKEQPDVTNLLKKTAAREAYSDSNVLSAKLIAYDYRRLDGIDGFRASDVAIIKVEGSNFPTVKLGTLDAVTQGANLSILGYPGNATDNGIVESTTSEATLTTGKVSAKKNAAGSDKMLIETDTTIGHGNSGGPALSDSGLVVGIATYTADGSGEGDGVYNYIRDIKDFTTLAAANNIIFDVTSKTQQEWEEGIDNFYTSHYSKALKNFALVEELYPNHSKVAEFTTAAQTRIANGEDVKDFPLIPVIIAAVVVLAGAGVGVFLIIRHNKKHAIYKAGVAQGTVQPVTPGMAPQSVVVAPGAPIVATPAVPAALAVPIAPSEPSPVVLPVESPAPIIPVTPAAPVVAPMPTSIPVSTEPPASPSVPVAPVPANPWFQPDDTPTDPSNKQ